MAFFVYIAASKRNGTLYIGMTDDLPKRAWQHRNAIVAGFTRDYGVNISSGTRCTKQGNRPFSANAA